MQDRLIRRAGAALLAASSLVGCSGQPQVTSEQSATITIDDSTNRANFIDCNRYQWFRMIDVGDQTHGVEAAFEFNGDKATAKWVKIHDFGGFTGSAWEGGVGNATATVSGSTYTIAGDAYGYGPKNPNKPGTESFKIVAYC